MMRVAINGFGRVGRGFVRAVHGRSDMEVVAVNDLAPVENLVYLLKYDTVYGRAPFSVTAEEGALIVDGKRVLLTAEKDPTKLPWKSENIDIVVECTEFLRAARKQGRT